jgi:hypothetical protein
MYRRPSYRQPTPTSASDNLGAAGCVESAKVKGCRRRHDCSLTLSLAYFHYRAILSAVPVPMFVPRMMRTRCRIIGADARPHWQKQPPRR